MDYYTKYSYRTAAIILGILTLVTSVGMIVTASTSEPFTAPEVLFGSVAFFAVVLLGWALWALYLRWWIARKGSSFLYKDVFILLSMVGSTGIFPIAIEFFEVATSEPATQTFISFIVFIVDLYILVIGVSAFSSATGHTVKYILGGYLLPVGVVLLAWLIFGIFFSLG